MRIASVLTAICVAGILYLLVLERETIMALAGVETSATDSQPDGAADDPAVSVVVIHSAAQDFDTGIVVRGRTEAARQVNVSAETSGRVISAPLRKGAMVATDQLLCELDPGTRNASLDETVARLAEAQSRLPESRARMAEAQAALPAAEARISDAQAGVPAAEARLAEAQAGVKTAQARLSEAEARVPAAQASLVQAQAGVPAAQAAIVQARARVPEAEARVAEARALVAEAEINLTAARELARSGFAAQTRVKNAESAWESAQAAIRAAQSQLEGARAGVETSFSQLQGANAAVANAESAVESAKASVQAAIGQVESARASVETARSNVETARVAIISAQSGLEGARAALESARSGEETARAGIQSAQAAVAATQQDIARLEIKAPFDGLLESDTAELGALLQPGNLCATVIQLDPIKLVGFVSETAVDTITLGAVANARLASGREISGQVTFLSRSADPQTRTFRVEIEVDNQDLTIRDGQTAEILIGAEGMQAHLLPQSALTLNDEGTLGVRIVDADNTARFAGVTILRDTVEGVWLSGLPKDATIIVVGQEYVTDGVRVAPSLRQEENL